MEINGLCTGIMQLLKIDITNVFREDGEKEIFFCGLSPSCSNSKYATAYTITSYLLIN